MEITFELTDHCPHTCGFCSSDAGPDKDTYLSITTIEEYLKDKQFQVINLSGGEPLSHPQFYQIHELCKQHLTPNGVIVVYTNLFQAIAYNATILPGGVRIICNVPIHENVNEIRALKMVEQGRAREGGPRFSSSKNFKSCTGECCHNPVIIPTGKLAISPCHKDTDIKELV